MPPEVEQPNERRALRLFDNHLSSSWQYGIVGPSTNQTDANREFVPLPVLEEFFDQKPRLTTLLQELYPIGAPLALDKETIREKYLRVFATLLCIGHGRYIEDFVRHSDLADNYLPFTTRPPSFPKIAIRERDFWENFSKYQWKFCAPEIVYRPDFVWQNERILPFIKKEKIGAGGVAVTAKIEIHPYYNKLLETFPNRGDHMKYTNVFVLKTYTTIDAERDLQTELKAFLTVQKNRRQPLPSLVKFFGSFEYDKTFNIILEYANGGNLEEYFTNTAPPTDRGDVLRVWESILGLLAALWQIHEIPSDNEEHSQTLQGWHQDIKPKNILVSFNNEISNYDCVFKLADLGLTHFKTKIGNEVSDWSTHGTRTYGPPELSSFNRHTERSRMIVQPTVDVWSLGCVFSEFATWITQGFEGVQEFRRQRREETRTVPNFHDTDCFHNGETALRCVQERHQHLSTYDTDSDHITCRVVEMIQKMLYPVENRQVVRYFYRTAERIMSQSNSELSSLNSGKSVETASAASGSATVLRMSPEQLPATPTWGTLEGMQSPPNTRVGLAPNIPRGSSDPISTQTGPSPSQALRRQTEGGRRELRVLPDRSASSGYSGTNLLEPGRQQAEPVSISSGSIRTVQSSSTTTQQVPERPDESLLVNKSNGSLGYLSVESAARWRNMDKSRSNHAVLPYSYHRNELGDRDAVFLVDDSSSMAPHWSSVLNIFNILGKIVKKSDRNGVEVYFTSDNTYRRNRSTSSLVDNIRNKGPQKSHNHQYDASMRLEKILQDYGEALRRHKTTLPTTSLTTMFKPKLPKPMNIYVLTDGIWQEQSNAEKAIANIVDTLEEYPKNYARQLGIQFIQFGDSESGKLRLDKLDSGLGLARDIVDTEPANGNIWKMILGANNKSFDKLGEPANT